MHRRHGVRLHPIRQRSSGAHRVHVILVADHRTPVTRMRRRDLVGDTSTDRAVTPDAPPVVPAPNPLTPRERDVLGMLVQGLPNKEIPDRLFIGDRTVKFHAQSIFRKLDVTNRTEAVSVALRRGIVALDPLVPSASDAA